MNRKALGGIDEPSYVSTGQLPPPERVRVLVDEAHARFKNVTEGRNSEVYPALARVPSELFGICVVGTSGNVYAVGDAEHEFSIMSVSKPFVFALVCEAIGPEEARRKLGVNATGQAFNSLGAIEQSPDGRTNPMVNSGAIATTSRAPAPRTGGGSYTTVCPDSPAAPCRSTRKSMHPRRRPISATRASPVCSRATAASTWTLPTRPTSTPGSAR
jgi:Glutaminase